MRLNSLTCSQLGWSLSQAHTQSGAFPFLGYSRTLCKLLSIRLGYLLTRLYLHPESAEMGLVNAWKKPAFGTEYHLGKSRLSDLFIEPQQGTDNCVTNQCHQFATMKAPRFQEGIQLPHLPLGICIFSGLCMMPKVGKTEQCHCQQNSHAPPELLPLEYFLAAPHCLHNR